MQARPSRIIQLVPVVLLVTLLCLGLPALSARAQRPHATQGWYQLSTISSSSTVTAATFLDTLTGWAVGTNGGLFVTHDGGQTWSTVVTGISDDLTMISFADSQNGYAAGDGILLHTTNGGASWQQTRLPTTANHLSSLSSPAGGPLFVVAKPDSAMDGVYKSTDGASWTNIFTGTVSTVLFVSPSEGYAIGQGGVFHTTDGGSTWQTVFNDGTYDLIDFVSPLVGYVAKGDGNVQQLDRTTDGGTSWTTVSAPDSGDCGIFATCRLSLAFVSPEQGLFGFASINYGSPNNPIEATSDGGSSWQSQSGNMGTGASVVGYRGSTPYVISDSGFYYYGFPIPAPTDTATNTPVPPPPTDTPVPPVPTNTPVSPPATATNSMQSNTPTSTSTTSLQRQPSVTPSATTGAPQGGPTAPAVTQPVATATPSTKTALTDVYQARHCHASSIQAVVSCAESSILRIDVQVQDGDVQGTGFVVRSDHTGTYVVTNRHVVEGGSPASTKVIAPNGRTTYRVLAIILNTAKSGTAGDLAVIKLAPTSLRPLAFGNSTRLRAGQTVASMGYGLAFQLGGPPSVTEGIISALGRDLGDGFGAVWIQHQSTINNGNSGGPLLDLSGDVVGVNTLSIDQLPNSDGSSQAVQGVFFAIPSSLVQPVVSRLISRIGHVGPEQLRATSTIVRVAAGPYSVALPRGWLVNHLHRSQPILISRDQLVQISLERQAHHGRLSEQGLENMSRTDIRRFGKPHHMALSHLSAGRLHGVNVTATYARRPYHQVVVVIFPTNGNRTILTLVIVTRRGATRQDMRQANQLLSTVRATVMRRH